MEQVYESMSPEERMEFKRKQRLLPCSECALLNVMTPCEACENNPKKRGWRNEYRNS